MKNIINIVNKLFANKITVKSNESSAQLTIDASVNTAFTYAGLKVDPKAVISARLIDDATGSWCVVTFFDDSTACRMNYTAYVDIDTGEVCGFSGEADKTWLEHPACCAPDVECIYEYAPLAIAV